MQVGVNDFTIVPRIGEYILLDKTQSHFANHVLFPVPTRKGKGILVSPTFHGNLLLGPTSRPINERLTQRQILNLIIKSAKKSIPEFDPRTAITSYTGLRSSSSRGDFIIEETKVSGFINVAGIDSPGLTASPAVALMVRDIIQQSLKTNYFVNTTPNFNFNPNRIPIIIKKTTGFKGTIDNIDPNLNIICRCELVTESEIIDSISRPLGSHDTDSVKRRTRAGMGKCQGNFCEPRVAALISKNIHVPIEDVVRRSIGSSVLPHLTVNDDDRRLLLEIANAPEPLLGTSKL
jgi:glycerol-3-phosphate dehydrogenase